MAYKAAVLSGVDYQVPEQNVILVEKSKLTESGEYNLSGDKYKVTQSRNSSNYEMVRLGDICDLYQPQTITAKELHDDGEFPVFGANGIIGKYHNYNHQDSEIVITCRGATCGSINKTYPKSWITGNAMVVKPKSDCVSKQYLFYILKNSDLTSTISGSAQPQITRTSLSPFIIPLPPLSIQEDIVAELDSYQKIIDGAKQIIDNWIPHINIDPEWKKCELRDVCYIDSVIEQSPPPDCIYIGADSIEEGTGRLIQKETIKQQSIRGAAVRFSGKKILYSKLRPYLNKVTITHFDGYCSTDIYPLSCYDSILYEYLYYVIKSNAFLQTAIGLQMGARLPRINKDQFLSMQISVPDLHTQQAIVDRIENEQKLIEGNRQLIALFEKKIKDRIEKLWKS